MDKNCKRIAWYTRKVAELGAVHWTKRTNKHDRRAVRLMLYKKALNETLNEALRRQK